MKLTHRKDYAEARREAYPPLGDQLDALWKALDASGQALPPEAQQVLDYVKSVKRRFPKS